MLTTPEAADLARVSYRRIDYWIRAGILLTATSPTPGSGHARVIPETEVLVAYALGTLSTYGIQVTCPLALRLATHVRLHGLHGVVEDGFLALDLDRLADPMRVLAELDV